MPNTDTVLHSAKDVRLINNQGTLSANDVRTGAIYFFLQTKKRWTAVCATDFGNDHANAACINLGFKSGTVATAPENVSVESN